MSSAGDDIVSELYGVNVVLFSYSMMMNLPSRTDTNL